MTFISLFEGRNVKLTYLQLEDAVSIHQWENDPDFARLTDSVPAAPLSLAQVQAKLDAQLKDKDIYNFGIRRRADDLLLGITTLSEIEWQHQAGWVYIAIGDMQQRRMGYGQESLSLALDFAFLELNLRRIQLTVFSYNTGAVALYEKVGFQHEGAFREYIQRNNQTYDMLLYGLLRHEWLARYPTGYADTIE